MIQAITCSRCGRTIPAADINLDRMLAKCTECNVVQSIESLAPAPPPTAGVVPSRKPEQVYKPDDTEYTVRDGQLQLVQRWYNPMFFGLLFFCCLWDGFLLFWYSIALSQPKIPWIMVLFPVGHLAVGAGLTYFVLCGFLNKTYISAGLGELSIRYAPLPCPGQQKLSTHELDQLYCEQQFGSKGTVTYNLMALLKNGKKVKLIGNCNDVDKARYLERKIEDFLKIADRQVTGEFLG